MKLEIELDPEEIEEIAQKVADIVLKSLSEIESHIKLPQTLPERPPLEKTWKMPDGEWWNDHAVSKVTGIAVTTLSNWRFNGKGPTYQKVGRRVVYARTDVLEFMNSFPKIRSRD